MPKRFLSVLFFSVIILFSCTKKEEITPTPPPEAPAVPAPVVSDILVGEFGSMTGGEATFGISTHRGIELAFKEVNASGGVKGRKLKLLSLDDQGKPEEAATAVTKLITQDKVTALLGEVASSRSLAAAPIAQQYKIPMISPSSTNPKVTEVGDYIFRVCFIDPFQGTAMAKFAREHLKLSKVAVMKDMKSDYSVGLSKFFQETFTALGGKIVTEETYSTSDIDFNAQLTNIKGKKPDGIFIPGYYTEVGLIANQARKAGLKVPLFGGDGWDSSKLYEIGKDAVVGGYFSNHYSTDVQDALAKKFIATYEGYFHEVPDGMAATGYDAAMVLVDAMNRAKSLASSDIRDAIAVTKDFAGVTGKITIDEKRNATKPAVVVKVIGASNQFVTTINP